MTPTELVGAILSPWGAWQLAGLAAGGEWLARRHGIDALRAWSAACVGAAVGAVGLGPLLRLPASLATGATPALEVMSIGALAGMILGHRAVAGGRHDGRLGVPLGLAVVFGRMGCFWAGCDFGAVTRLPWGVRYGTGTPAWWAHRSAGWIPEGASHALPVHPTQLYEVLVGVAMVAVAWGRGGRNRLRRTVAVYAVGRFAIELLRGDARATFAGVSLPAWLCVAALAWALTAPSKPRLAAAAP